MIYSKIAGTGSYLPKKILTNRDLEKIVETTDQWIVERTGIKQRHVLADDETASSLGLQAAKNALDAAQLMPDKIDLIIVATATSDRAFPSTACLIQEKLQVENCPAFDVTAACAGFSYALSIADMFIKTATAQCALVVGTEALSRVTDWQDRSTCILFGDGAGAVILTPSTEPGIIATKLHANGKYKDYLYMVNPAASLADRGKTPSIKMQGSEVFKSAVKCLGDLVSETISNHHLPNGIDWFIPHQANLRIITAMAKKLNLPMEKVILTIEKHGNTSSASVPLALDLAVRDGRIKRGHHILLESFGGGFAWGSALIKY